MQIQHERYVRAAAILLLACVHVSKSSAEVTTIGQCEQVYVECLSEWREERIRFLKSESGYLNLAGLYWLREGRNTFGSGQSQDLRFPETAEDAIGSFELRDDQVVMIVNDSVDVRFDDRRVGRMPMPDDTSGLMVEASHRHFVWSIIRRDHQFAVRLRDLQNPLLQEFGGIEHYETDEALRIVGRLERYAVPRKISVGTVIEGLSYNPTSPGTVSFEIDNQEFELEAYDTGNELFFVFGDTTNRRETYPAGRFLYAAAPDENGNVHLDFNLAQNPPCAFNEFATCPVASPRNRLQTGIKAGEMYRREDH